VVIALGRTTISIYDRTKKRFIKVKGKLELANGKPRSEDAVLNKLVDFFESFPSKEELENILKILEGNVEEYDIPYVPGCNTMKKMLEMAKCLG
jgi:arsenate reductase-like glutaredoxin family protein